MNRSTRNWSLALTLAVALAVPLAVYAVPITPSSGAALGGAVPPAGQVLASKDLPFEILASGPTVLASGHVQTQVVRETGTGLMRFEYRMFVDAGSPGGVNFVSPASFGSFSTDVDYITGSAGDVAPSAANRSVNSHFISYFFPANVVAAGQSTLTLYVRTDALAYSEDGWVRTQLGSATADSFGAFQPAAPIPEPGTLALWLTALLWPALRWQIRRSRG